MQITMKHHTFIFICTLFLLVRTVYAQIPSPVGGGWYSFEGNEESFLQASNSDFLDTRLQDAMTIELWIYPKSLPEVGKIWFLLQKMGSYEIRLTKSGSVYWIEFIAGKFVGGGRVHNLPTNQWTHIACQFRKDEPPHFSRFFANGRWETAAPSYPQKWDLPLSDFPLVIGRRFDGAIDEIRISNVVRYQGNFALPDIRFEPDEHTMALWHFDGAGETVLEDSSGNGNHLSVGVNPFPVDSSGRPVWQTKAPMPTPRTEMRAVALGKKIYVFGGYVVSSDRFKTTDITEIYDSVTDSWSQGPPMPEGKNHAGIGVVNGKFYIIGGGGDSGISKSCLEYDPTRDTWSRKADMTHQRWAAGVAELDGKLYVIGGWDGAKNVAPIEVYDPTTDSWQERAPLPTPRDHLVVAAVDGKIYAIGGRGPGLEVEENLVHEYDPKLDLWRSRSPMPTWRSGMMEAVVNKRIHVIGGEGPLTDAHEIYNPMTDKWEIALPVPTARSGLAGGVIEDNIYAIGGHGPNVFNVNELFLPSTSTSVAIELRQKRLTTFGAVKQNFLGQNFPNPFNLETWIPYKLTNAADVSIKIYNVSRQLVRVINLGRKEAGIYTSKDKAAYWDGKNDAGEYVSSGAYFYEFAAGNFRSVKKMVILK